MYASWCDATGGSVIPRPNDISCSIGRSLSAVPRLAALFLLTFVALLPEDQFLNGGGSTSCIKRSLVAGRGLNFLFDTLASLYCASTL